MTASIERPGISIWNRQEGWTMPPMPVLKDNEFALAIEPGEETLSEWDADAIARKLGYQPESRYLGENDVNHPLGTEVYLYLGTYGSEQEVRDRASALRQKGIPQPAIKILSATVAVAH